MNSTLKLVLPRHLRPFSSSACTRNAKSASQKLFEDAAREEAEGEKPPSAKVQYLEQKHENWTGDEPVEHAVLRMLVDKYKPLRSGSIETADTKLKKAPPVVTSPAFASDQHPTSSSSPSWSTPTTGSWASEPLIPGIEGHRPWHTTYKAPTHTEASVRSGSFPAARTSSKPLDERERRKFVAEQKKLMHATRLTQAKEGTLDYKLGLNKTAKSARPNPVSMRGWNSLIEDRIEKARSAGMFNTIKGRGQPLAKTHEETNPFVSREEFLMNRIVQRNGAAPPWVEIQGELDESIASFRSILRQAWTRRAVAILSTSHSPRQISLSEVASLRDPGWEEREQAYHERAIEEVNSVVRKYNGLAPYAVRRAYYLRKTELEKLYADEEVIKGIVRTAQQESPATKLGAGLANAGSRKPGNGGEEMGLGQQILRVIQRIFSRTV